MSTGLPDAGFDPAANLVAAKDAQIRWAALPVEHRLQLIGRVRHLIAERARRLALAAAPLESGAPCRPLVETLASQVLPLADACRFLEKKAAALLQPKHLGRGGRPLWLAGLDAEVFREPFGVVLLIAPSNYPLFLPGVQALQALAAGNAVLLKPGCGGTAAALELAALLVDCGLESRLFTVFPESPAAGCSALALAVDKVVFTGSFATGVRVLTAAAGRAIPCIAELSGCDAVFVRRDANLTLCADALLFGLNFNASASCIAPRRVYVERSIAGRFQTRLATAMTLSQVKAPACARESLAPLLADALEQGAVVLAGGLDTHGELHLPCLLGNAHPRMRLMQTDHLHAVLCLTAVDNDDHALKLAADCPYALGATIFSRDAAAARKLAARVWAGHVIINDLIVPTADPRVAFGGWAGSGYGVTRGAEGLLEMTRLKTVQIRHGHARPHFAPPRPGDELLFQDWIEAAHGKAPFGRLKAGLRVVRRLLQRSGLRPILWKKNR